MALLVRPQIELEILLIKRAEHDGDPWSGHMALPGGRRDAIDPDLQATALRETAEEVGIDVFATGRVLGRLDEITPRTQRLPSIVVAPFVAAVPSHTTPTPSAVEVEAALWIPLPALREPGAVSELLVELQDGPRSYPSLRYGEYVIWGLTHRVLSQFLAVCEEAGL